MKPLFIFLFTIHFSLLTIHSSFSQEPEWVDPVYRTSLFPAAKFLVGFRSESFAKGDDPEPIVSRLVKIAKTNLVEQIRVTIKSTATFNLENLNSESLEHFRQASTSQAEASLTGLKTETYVNKKKGEAYAIAWLNISDLISSCKANLKDKELRISQQLKLATDMATSGDLANALSAYQECYPMLRDMENDIALLISIGKEQEGSQSTSLEFQVNAGINNLRKGRVLSFDEVCYFLVDGLKQQIQGTTLDGFITMGAFTYQESSMGSRFASRLQATLEQKMTQAGFNLRSEEAGRQALKEGAVVYILSGTYWDEGQDLKIIANIRRINDGANISSMEEYVTKNWLESNGISFLPENYLLAIARQKEFIETPVVNDDLDVSIWTNRGADNPFFHDGDTMYIYMQVNKPCYVRLIYYLADGIRTLLADNFQINTENVNKAIRYRTPFVCAEPFGSETLQIMAQTQPFQPLVTMNADGYEIISEDVGGIMENFRGMKSTTSPLLKVEKRIDLTTVSR